MYKFIAADNSAVVHTLTSRCIYLNDPPTIHTEAYLEWALTNQTSPYAAPPAPTQRQIDAALASNIEALWQAAHDYEYAQISGVAVGLLVLGVIQGKPKAFAVQGWSKDIWSLYYSRKPLITDASDPAMLDFSSVGTIPHSIPELMAELGL